MSSPHTPIITLEKLTTDIPGLTEPLGGIMIEACMICFEDQGHSSGLELNLLGNYDGTIKVLWEGAVTENMWRAWRDKAFATETAACGIAILLIEELAGYTVVEAANRGEGIDYWLGNRETLVGGEYLRTARLEVSGIRQGDSNRIEARLQQKIKQPQLSAGWLPVYIVIVEFSTPSARVVQI